MSEYEYLDEWKDDFGDAVLTEQEKLNMMKGQHRALMFELYKLVEHDAINEVRFDGFPYRYMGADIELFNYRYRMCCITEYMGVPTVCRMSTLPNLKNIYGKPTRCLVTYPDMSTAELNVYTEATPDGVIPFYDTIVPGDGRISRVMAWIRRYCDTQLTIDTQIVTHRTPFIMTGTDSEALEDEKLIKDIATGVKVISLPLNVVSDIQVLNLNAPWDVPDCVQWQAEIMRRIYACLGLDAPTWQKKERLIVDEQEANDETLSRVLRDMIDSRRISCEMANEKYGWNVTVDVAEAPRISEVNNENTAPEP